jgi:HAD superfamily hydrolase (TIGR01490 family)
MTLAIFDLDNTLIADDSDYLWGQFLVDQRIVDKATYEAMNTKFYQDYQQGTLDMHAFLQFALKPLTEHPLEKLHRWREQFLDAIIKPILLNAAHALVEKHRVQGDTLLVITATNRFITEPIVKMYGIDHLIATTPEFSNGRYTGNIIGIPSFREGKVTLLNQWLTQTGESLENSVFYSDSHNDLPLLELVDNPVCVNPDDTLQQIAITRNWPIINLRDV